MKQKNKKKSAAINRGGTSVKPLGIGVLMIIVVIGLFALKSYLSHKKNPASVTNNAVKEELVVPLIEPEDVAKLIFDKNTQIIDIRSQEDFNRMHIENSINVPYNTLNENKKLFNKNKKIILTDTMVSQEVKELTNHLKTQGFDVRLLNGGIDRYSLNNLPLISMGNPDSLQDNAKVTPLSAALFIQKVNAGQYFNVVDVRLPEQFQTSHIEGAINIPLEELEKRKTEIPQTNLIVCDEDPLRSFQAGVKLHDMHIWGAYFLSDSLSLLKENLK